MTFPFSLLKGFNLINIKPITVNNRLPITKKEKAKTDFINPDNVQGAFPFVVLLVMSQLNRNGINTCEINTTQLIPMMETSAIDFKDGCFAKIIAPSPRIVVIAEKKIEERKEERF